MGWSNEDMVRTVDMEANRGNGGYGGHGSHGQMNDSKAMKEAMKLAKTKGTTF